MNYTELTPREKSTLSPLLIRKLGTTKGKYFTVRWDGKDTTLLCQKIKMNWAEEHVSIFFTKLGMSSNPLSVITIPFLADIVISFDPDRIKLARKKNIHQEKAEINNKPRVLARNVDQAIEILKDMGPYQASQQFELSERETIIAHRVLATAIGVLSGIPKRERGDLDEGSEKSE